MQYTQVTFQINSKINFVQDILTQQLADIGFESFISDNPNNLTAYIQTTNFSTTNLGILLQDFPYQGVSMIKIELCEDKDWNEEWEKNSFQPIEVGSQCIIRAPFHEIDRDYQHQIIINPKMAFGTGSHQTTYLILSTLFQLPIKGKSVLDMGCGTGVLAILAKKLGASSITAIDIDDWCTANAKENCQLNKIDDIEILLGDVRLIENRHFDVIIANINRNILLMDMPQYAKALNPDGLLIISGFYTEDISVLISKAEELGLKKQSEKIKDNWAMLTLRKINN